MSRIVIVSNRLPVTIGKKGGEHFYHPSAGGLATGLNSLDESLDKIWIGWPGHLINDTKEKEQIERELEPKGLVPVFLSENEIELYYEGFSNKTIWPHFHYFTQYTAYKEEFWLAYQNVNQKFADRIIKLLRPDDILWIHDYQLMLLPSLIRSAHPEITIGFFLHIPFPSYEIFRILPWRYELLQGLLGADQIGFHTYGYMRHFLSAAYRITGFEHKFGNIQLNNRTIHVDVFPMGIDYGKFAHAEVKPGSELGLQLEKEAEQRKLIISIDRLDYTKGIPQRIEAFEQFIEQHPEYLGKVSLVLIVIPSRSNVDQYQELKDEVDTLVGRINGKYSYFNWSPIQYFYRSFNFENLCQLYQFADIAMITPLRDGMNLVAKEFVASKHHSQKGVLILSEMAGAASELTDALIVNPQDRNAMVIAIATALEMSEEEQSTRLNKMQLRLKSYTVKTWATGFIREIENVKDDLKKHQTNILDAAQIEALQLDYQMTEKRLFLLDYDGTLMGFQTDPTKVAPDPELLDILAKIKADPKNKLVVTSGRDRHTLEEWLSHLEIDMAAEHGVWTKLNGNWESNKNITDKWKEEVRPALDRLVNRTPGSFVEEKDYSLAWHYRKIDKDLGAKRVREFRDVLRYLTASLDLQVLEGNKVVEIKNSGVNKGKAALNWLNTEKWDYIVAIGDDNTDEDTFNALPKTAHTFKVGLGQTAARYGLISVEAVRDFLKNLVHK